MKKILTVSSFAAVSIFFAYCCSPKKISGTKEAPKSTYESSVSSIIMASCSPCHIPSKGGNKRPYDNYANVKSDIDEIIRRVELEPGVRGFMPMKGQKLPAETIAAFKKWKADGMLEK